MASKEDFLTKIYQGPTLIGLDDHAAQSEIMEALQNILKGHGCDQGPTGTNEQDSVSILVSPGLGSAQE